MSPDASRPLPRPITSHSNERVKLIRSLAMRKARKESGLFVAEGPSVLLSARDSGAKPQILVFLKNTAGAGATAEIVKWAGDAGAELLEVSEPVLAKLAAKDNPQTVLGVFAQAWSEPPRPDRLAKTEVWVVLETVRDPGNLGTIIRTIDAVGAAGVILVGNCCDPYSRESVRATMGSIFGVPVVKMLPDHFVELARSWPGDVVGTHLEARQDFRT